MAQFNYNDYNKVVELAQSGENSNVKVGFFKLKDNGDAAIVRIGLSSIDELKFATIHKHKNGTRWEATSCLNTLGSSDGNVCPLCAEAAKPGSAVSKAKKVCYVPMLASYKNADGTYAAPIPVIWERPAAFSRELATKLSILQDLKNTYFLITRNGAANSQSTTYSLDNLPENLVANYGVNIAPDFSAFNNFKIERHSYWVRTADEMNAYLRTGTFPQRAQTNAQPAQAAQPAPQAFAANQGFNAGFNATPFNPTPASQAPFTPVGAPGVQVAPQATPFTPTPTAQPAAQPTAQPAANPAPQANPFGAPYNPGFGAPRTVGADAPAAPEAPAAPAVRNGFTPGQF